MKPLVKVVWSDAQDHPDNWVAEADVEAFGDVPCDIVSVGFLVSKTDKYLTLAGDWDEVDQNYGRVTKIVTKMVISMNELTSAS